MDYATIRSTYYCGIDLHARSMYVCVMDNAGKIHVHRNFKNDFSLLLDALAPYRESLAVGVESTFNWYWLADGCHQAGIAFYLGHAFYMKSIHGGKKKNDRIDSRTLADLMRTNFFPLAYAYPQQMRATRDLLRRRHRFVALRAEGYTHIQNTFSQQAILDPLHAAVKKKTTRRALCERFPDPDLALSIHSDLDMIEALDAIIYTLEKQLATQAKHHDRKAFSLLKTIPGVGKMLALTILYEIHTIERFRSASAFSSYSRLVKVNHESAGKKIKGGNNRIGNPHLKWAFTEIILRAQVDSPAIKKYYEKLKSKHGPAKAKSVIAHKFAIATYHMLKNETVFDEKQFIGGTGGAVNPASNWQSTSGPRAQPIPG
jgi:transposase